MGNTSFFVGEMVEGNLMVNDTLRNQLPLRLQVSETEPLSLQKSAKSRDKNPNSLRSDMRIFAPNADSYKLRGSMSPANANWRRLLPELLVATNTVKNKGPVSFYTIIEIT